MSLLSYHGRPWVNFDPANRDHRQWYADFQRLGTWGRCPVRFYITDDTGNLVTMIQRRLIEYYVKQEFRKSQKKAA